MYSEWAQGQIGKLKGILNAARQDHTSAVKERIDKVRLMGSVTDVTKQLFEVSKVCRWDGVHILTQQLTFPKETAHLEAKAFELEQKTAIVSQAKLVLDSWVRYESQVKQRQQKELAETIIGKIQKELENPKTLQQILNQAVADVESKSHWLEP